jgi:hypothetical protein
MLQCGDCGHAATLGGARNREYVERAIMRLVSCPVFVRYRLRKTQ